MEIPPAAANSSSAPSNSGSGRSPFRRFHCSCLRGCCRCFCCFYSYPWNIFRLTHTHLYILWIYLDMVESFQFSIFVDVWKDAPFFLFSCNFICICELLGKKYLHWFMFLEVEFFLDFFRPSLIFLLILMAWLGWNLRELSHRLQVHDVHMYWRMDTTLFEPLGFGNQNDSGASARFLLLDIMSKIGGIGTLGN